MRIAKMKNSCGVKDIINYYVEPMAGTINYSFVLLLSKGLTLQLT